MANAQTSREKLQFTRDDFPDDFEFGTATSSYQIEGSSYGGCGSSHWDTFAATPGNTKNTENGSIACDHYHKWAEDLDLIRDCGLDSYRFSVSWARVMPEGRGKVNAEGLDFYERLVDGMLERGINPYMTLYHWELPSELSDMGGWQNRDIADWFADFTEVVANRIGDRVKASATFNEPWCISWLSHFLGHHAPGLRDIRATANAMHHILLAHGRSVGVMRGLGMKNIGAVMNFEFSQPADESPESAAAAKLYDGIYNRWFLGGVFNKAYPEDVLAGLEPYMPKNYEKDFDIIGAPVDWLGINYYTRKLIKSDGTTTFPGVDSVEGPLAKTALGWEIYPEGLHHFITWADKNYSKGLPIHVTENGMASAEPTTGTIVDDPDRIAFIDQHVTQIQRAIADGAPVKSYFIWSLMDNFEWAEGYDPRFGLVHVDFETLKRTPKASWHALKEAIGK